MRATLWLRVKEVFGEALDVPAARRAEFVRDSARGDARLEAEVLALLGHRERAHRFLSPPDGATRSADSADVPRAGATRTASAAPVAGVPGDPLLPGEGALVARRWRLGPRLGAGAFGAVHRARDLHAGRDVAVKVLPASSTAEKIALRRECALLRRARFEGIVELLDDGIEHSWAFLVMRLVEGRPFPGDDAGGPVPWERLAPLARDLLAALGRLHWVGLLHRDLKPENVLVDADGRITVVDLGIARAPEEERRGGAPTAVAGTPAYLAPELLRGFPASRASEIYAVGVMLWEALAGEPLHDAGTFEDLALQRCTRPPRRLLEAAPEVPPHVAAAVDLMVDVDPARRPVSAAESAALLRGETAESARDPALPFLGDGASVDAVVAAVRARRSLDLCGPRGSGRSRTLDEAEARLVRDGFRVMRTVPSSSTFASVAPGVGGVPGGLTCTLAEVRSHVVGRLASLLSSGVAVFADDWERIDAQTREVLGAVRERGSVVRVREGGEHGGHVPAPLREEERRTRFRGPDRVFHLREDAARELHARTRGRPGDVVRELRAWHESGIARREDAVFVVGRAGLEGLDSRLVPALPSADGAPALDGSVREAAAVLEVARCPLPIGVVARALRRPPWLVEADCEILVAAGLARRSGEAEVEAVASIDAAADWDPQRRIEAHSAIADGLAEPGERRLAHLVAADRCGDVAREAAGLARRLHDAGRHERAAAVVADGLRAFRWDEETPAGVGEDLLAAALDVALALATPAALDRALAEFERTMAGTPRAEALETVCRAALRAVSADPEGAWTSLEPDLPGADEATARRRHVVRVFAARLLGDAAAERRAVADVARWARRRAVPESHAHLAESLAWLRYREERFDRAAALHARAARRWRRPTSRLSACLNAASAAVEACDLERAGRLAGEARVLAARIRHATHEARAEWLLRVVEYRSGRATEPDFELVEALATGIPPAVRGLALLNEAAVAWRGGRAGTARTLALDAAACLERTGRGGVHVLARALAVACGDAVPVEEVERLRDAARACPAPGIGEQALALLGGGSLLERQPTARGEPHTAPDDGDALADVRQEVLSRSEVLARLGAVRG